MKQLIVMILLTSTVQADWLEDQEREQAREEAEQARKEYFDRQQEIQEEYLEEQKRHHQQEEMNDINTYMFQQEQLRLLKKNSQW